MATSGPVLLSFPSYQPASPTRVKLPAGGASLSPAKSISASSPKAVSTTSRSRRSCMCSPTNHPGSFRCSLHKERKPAPPAVSSKPVSPASAPSRGTVSPSAQHAPNVSGCSKSKGMASPFAHRVPMGTGHWARRALVPSPAVQQQQHRKRVVRFVAGPSRLSAAAVSQ